jgi:Domain of unknown function (DUF4760)
MSWSGLGDWTFWEHLGKVAPIVTALIALTAAIVAVFSLLAQVHIARRRAAIDVFLKTEMDQGMLTAYQDYVDGLEAAKQYKDVDQFKVAEPKLYRAVRTYLDVNELICIGINHKAFDQRVCYGFWYGILDKARTEGSKIIDHARKPADGAHTYDHILSVNDRWRRPGKEKWRR